MTNGRVLLSFDDRNIESWTAARGILDAHSARVTFFVVEADLLDGAERNALVVLASDGHTIGSHGCRHLDAPAGIEHLGAEAYLDAEIRPSVDALEELGVPVLTFAYPNSRRDAASDAVLLGEFDRLRGGAGRSTSPADTTDLVIPDDAIAEARVLLARGIDTWRIDRRTDDDTGVLLALLDHVAEHGGNLPLLGHEIAERGAGNCTDPARLEFILAACAERELDVVGWDELPEVA